MPEKVIYKYRLWCIEEKSFITTWAETEPNICPNNHANRTIDTSQTTIVDKNATSVVQVGNSADGYYQSTSEQFRIQPGVPGETSYFDLIYPMDLAIWTAEFTSTEDMVGDEFSCVISPGTIIGVIVRPGMPGDKKIYVSRTVIDLGILVKGIELVLDNTIYTESMGRVTAIDPVNYTVTLEKPLTKVFPFMSMVRIYLYLLKKQFIDRANRTYIYGRKGLDTKKLSAGTVMKFAYKNNNGKSKTLHWDLEYNYT